MLEQLRTSGTYRYKTLEQGAATSVLVATWPPLEGDGGHYFEDGNEAPVVDAPVTTQGGSGVAAYALDPGTPSGSGSSPSLDGVICSANPSRAALPRARRPIELARFRRALRNLPLGQDM